MNRYQREKAKRKKKLSNLGVSYSGQKRILRKYNLEEVDKIIDGVKQIKESKILDRLLTFVVNGVNKILEVVKQYSELKIIEKEQDKWL